MAIKKQTNKQHRSQEQGAHQKKPVKKNPKKEIETTAVMFVDHTVGGMLAKRLQKAEDAIAEWCGYRIRIVETSGTQLCRLLPNTNSWSGHNCGRSTCLLAQKGMRICHQRNIMYESACTLDNKDTDPEIEDKFKKFEMENALDVGELARSIFERAQEHR